MAKRPAGGVVVIGLGRFGRSLAQELMKEGEEVLGIDADSRVVQELSGRLTHVVEADTTNAAAMEQLGVGDFGRAVIAVGTDLEASILSASITLDLEVPQVWAKATSQAHARILTKLGVHHVVRPEHDTGRRVAHMLRGQMQEYLEVDDDYVFVKTTPPPALHGRSLGGYGVRELHGVTVVGVKPAGGRFSYATADTVLRPGDTIIVSGSQADVEAFAALG